MIRSPLRESLRHDIKDTVLFIFPAIMFVALTAILYLYSDGGAPNSGLIHENLERGSTVLATTSIVSALSLLTTYVSIRRHKVIEWQGIEPRKTR